MRVFMFLTKNIVLLLVFTVVVFVPDFASANEASVALRESLCSAYDLVNGGAGKAIATIAILTLGFMALLGRIQWGLVILVAVGIAVIFAAPEIADAVGGGDGNGCVSSGGGSGQGPVNGGFGTGGR